MKKNNKSKKIMATIKKDDETFWKRNTLLSPWQSDHPFYSCSQRFVDFSLSICDRWILYRVVWIVLMIVILISCSPVNNFLLMFFSCVIGSKDFLYPVHQSLLYTSYYLTLVSSSWWYSITIRFRSWWRLLVSFTGKSRTSVLAL